MKAPARKTSKSSKPAEKASSGRASSSSAKTKASSAAAKKAPAKKVTTVSKKAAPAKAPASAKKSAVKKAAVTTQKAAPAKKAPAKKAASVVSKASAKKAAPVAKKAAATKALPAKKVAPKPAPKTAVKAEKTTQKSAAKPSAKSGRDAADTVKAAARTNAAANAKSVTPTPKPLGKRAAKRVMMEQMMQPEVVPSHAPDAPKVTFTHSPERLMTPPLPTAVKKDPKRANNWKTVPVEELTDQDIQAMPDSEYMNDVQMAYFRRKLQLLKADMLANAGETTEHLREDTVVVPDPADRATIEEEHALELRTRDRERKLLKKIEQAIARIDAGDYGYCDETGEPIGVGRLMARPTASLSLEAQQRRELKQKMFGD